MLSTMMMQGLLVAMSLYNNEFDLKREEAEEVKPVEVHTHTNQNDRRAEAVYQPPADVIIMNVTGYTAGPESTGKSPGDKGYGVTTSGEYVEQGVTVAAGKNIPFYTKIYIPYFDGKPGFGDGIFTVHDRGGAIGSNNIDVYFESVHEANLFGRKNLEVKILGGN